MDTLLKPRQKTTDIETTKQDTLRDNVIKSTTQHLQKAKNVYKEILTEVEKPLFTAVLEFVNHNQSKAARVLGLSRGTLRKKLKLYELI